MIADLQDHSEGFDEEDDVNKMNTPKRPTSVIDLITPTARPPRPQEDADGFVPVGKGQHSNTGSYRPSPPMSETSSPMTTTSCRYQILVDEAVAAATTQVHLIEAGGAVERHHHRLAEAQKDLRIATDRAITIITQFTEQCVARQDQKKVEIEQSLNESDGNTERGGAKATPVRIL
jgi:hypothetical protein